MKRTVLSQPTLLLIMGVAASGKTSLSRRILQRLQVTYLDNNFIADAFYPDTRNDPAYTAIRPHFYEALYRITEENLALGNSVLLDVPHVKEMQDVQWQILISGMVQRTRAKLVVLRCRCSEETLKRRIETRGEERDAWKLGNWHAFLQEQPIAVFIPFEHLDIQTDAGEVSLEPIIDYIVKNSAADTTLK